MKIKHLPWILASAAIMLFSSYTLMYPTGAPAGVTGSPGDGSSCTSCHGGTATTTANCITSTIPASGYVAGTVYAITATNPLTSSGKYGFELSPQNASGTQLGTLAAGSGTHLVGGTKYVTHTSANSSTKVWTFNWTAPAAGTGPVTFYAAFAKGANGSVTLSNLTVQEAAGVPGAAGPITGNTTVCKNTTETYSISAITGATSYTWTAPAGATILSGQGTTSVSVSYTAAAISGNLSVYGSNTTGNGTPSSRAITVNSVPDAASSITGSSTPCQTSTQTYSVTNVSGVTFTWTVPAGSTIASGQGTNSISIAIGGTNGDISVIPSNTCGNGTNSTTTITVGLVPSALATPDGPSMVNLQNTTTSTFTTTSIADSYVWSISPASAGTISGTTATATVTWNNSFIGNADIKVKGHNSCGDGAFSTAKTVQVLNTTGIDVNEAGIKVVTDETSGTISLIMNTSANQAKVMLLDLSGRILVNTTVPGTGTSKIENQLKAGVYIIVVDAGTSSLKKKILVM